MKPIGPGQPDIAARYRTLLTLWFAISVSMLTFLLLIHLSPVEKTENQQLTLILNSLALIPFALSFLFKQKGMALAVEGQRLDLVQTVYVLCFALCEGSALLGLLDHFQTGSKYYYVAFAIGGVGMLIHFPRKQHLLDASYKKF